MRPLIVKLVLLTIGFVFFLLLDKGFVSLLSVGALYVAGESGQAFVQALLASACFAGAWAVFHFFSVEDNG